MTKIVGCVGGFDENETTIRLDLLTAAGVRSITIRRRRRISLAAIRKIAAMLGAPFHREEIRDALRL